METVRLDEGVINNLPSGEVVESDNLIAIWQDGKTVKVPISHLSGSESIVFINPVQINSNTQANTNTRYLADTTNGSFTLTLPSAPVVGDYIEILDSHDKFDINNLMIACNGYKISGILEDVIVDLKRISISLTYVSDVWGWYIEIKLTEYDHLISKGKDGTNGKSAYELWVSYGNTGKTFEQFLTTFKGLDGKDGKDGLNGYTPVKGIDYFDGQNGLKGLTGERGRDGKDGINGYTPIKGIDYFDGIDGPNTVSNTTTTNLNGIIIGNGTIINSISLPNDNTKFLDGTGTFTTITSNTPIDNSSSISDVILNVGEIAYINYNNTSSIPLNIATEEGIYEITIVGFTDGTCGVSADTQLRPNNTTYTDKFIGYQMYMNVSDNDSPATISPSGFRYKHSQFMLSPYIPITHLKLTTFTKAKSMSCQGMGDGGTSSTQTNFTIYNMLWKDTTTPWTSLGTLILDGNQSGKIVIKRII